MKYSIQTLLLLLSVFWVQEVFPQFYNVQWGADYGYFRRTTILDAKGKIGSKYYVYQREYDGMAGDIIQWRVDEGSIMRLDEDMKVEDRNTFKIEINKQKLAIHFGFFFKDKLHLITSYLDGKAHLQHVLLHTVDPNSLKINPDNRKLCSTPFRTRLSISQPQVSISQDSSHFLILLNILEKGKDPEKFHFYVFDSNFEQVWNKEVSLPFRRNEFTIKEHIVDNQGNVHILGKRRKERKEFEKGQANYVYYIETYSKDGGESEYELAVEDKFLSDLHLVTKPEGNLVCMGFYGDHDPYYVNGTYYFKLDAKCRKIEKVNLFEFKKDFLMKGLEPIQRRQMEARLRSGVHIGLGLYRMKEIIRKADGGFIFTAEQYFCGSLSNYPNPKAITSLSGTYYFNTILVVNMGIDGEVEWAIKIPKHQRSLNDDGRYASFATMLTKDKIYFIYNDVAKNIEEQRIENITNFRIVYRNVILAVASVDIHGNVKREKLISNDEMPTNCRPAICRQVSPSEMLLYGDNGKRAQFGRLIIK
ncbi:MAG TPA: hypothetical protein ENJ82_02355 [Bacteroidetes bacterium]|nr:hypothetical protein [Bacteroidota bacterium]